MTGSVAGIVYVVVAAKPVIGSVDDPGDGRVAFMSTSVNHNEQTHFKKKLRNCAQGLIVISGSPMVITR